MKTRIDNKAKARWAKLFKLGYYIRPQKYNNCTVYVICKDLNPVNCRASRTIHGEVNKATAQMLRNIFGFVIRKEVLYFGNAEPVQSLMIRQQA